MKVSEDAEAIKMCLYPKLIHNPKYRKTKKNGGIIPPISDERVKYVPIGCGNCIECRKQYARSWQIRLLEEIKKPIKGYFITLTFSNESIAELIKNKGNKKRPELKHFEGYMLDNQLATTAVHLFLGRWRKKFKTSLRHWLITELGHNGTENIHLHGIVWTYEDFEEIRNLWQYGYVFPYGEHCKKNYVNEATVNYIIKYVTKVDDKHTLYKSIILTSPGIGNNYKANEKHKYNGENTNKLYRDWETDRKSTRLNSSHSGESRMPSSA